MMATKLGMCIRFKATDVRPTGRSAMGAIRFYESYGYR